MFPRAGHIEAIVPFERDLSPTYREAQQDAGKKQLQERR